MSRTAYHGARDIAVSHAVLGAVSRGESPATFRLYRPDDILAFGAADRHSSNYPLAVRSAEAHGFTALQRLAGGRAAVFHDNTLAFSWAIQDPDPRARIAERFGTISSIMRDAFTSLGIDARVGEVPGEYCPGEWSVNVGGHTKVMGVGQRLVRGGAHVGGVVVVDDGHRIRDVLIPVYRALGIDWDPRTAGSLADRSPGLTVEKVADAIEAELGRVFSLEDREIPPSVIERSEPLVEQHLPRVA